MKRLSLALIFVCLFAVHISAQSTKYWSAMGNDSNDGDTPATAWASVAKVNAELAAPNNGITKLVIDTNAPIYLTETLTIGANASGLTVTTSGERQADLRAYKVLAAGEFTLPDSTNADKVYHSTDAQAGSVLWELTDPSRPDSLKWFTRIGGTSFAANKAALQATPGSFMQDGANGLYFHPFDGTNPNSDGKIYVRSRRFVDIYSSNAGNAIDVTGGRITIQNLMVGGTCVANPNGGDASDGYSIKLFQADDSVVRDCYLYAWSKHALGVIEGTTGAKFLAERVRAEQGTPWGDQTAFVSFTDMNSPVAAHSLEHTYRNCQTLKNAGLPGSTAGQNLGYLVFYTHFNGDVSTGRFPYNSILIDGGHFPNGRLANGSILPSGKFLITNSKFGDGVGYGEMLVDRSWMQDVVVPEWVGGRVTVTNSIIKRDCGMPFQSTRGQVIYRNNTIDSSRCDSFYPLFLFASDQFTNFTFENNLVRLRLDPDIVANSCNGCRSSQSLFGGVRAKDEALLVMRNNGYDLTTTEVYNPYKIPTFIDYHFAAPTGRPGPQYLNFNEWLARGIETNATNGVLRFDTSRKPSRNRFGGRARREYRGAINRSP
ncbi:MAG: hypothetical protein MSG64_01920 [Pyrinomonadaceae bacterium MAG19_C2-C3]|nr:hypothetical protein [Pyrinomonadaceae bacterium MAG19_C2-C3]